ncbi:MAG: response regulator [Burkholderiaceae bacterium]
MRTDHELTVLVVDDQLDTLVLLERELQAANMRVRTAHSGEDALAALARERPDAVLLDVLMHGSDGFDTCERLRAVDRDLPVIFMTGLDGTDHVVRGFEVGGNDYVTKPVSTPEVIARLLAHLEPRASPAPRARRPMPMNARWSHSRVAGCAG